MPRVEKVAEGCLIGEGPHWDVSSQSLYFVDVFGKQILKYSPSTKKVTRATVEKPVSIIIPIEGRKNEFLISQGNELVVIFWDGESDKYSVIQKLCDTGNSPESPKTLNDAKCDSSGRLWIGATSLTSDFLQTPPVGFLYTLDTSKELKSKVDKIRIPNGLTFNEKSKKMYYIDSLSKTVDQFDFDINNGTISNRQIWFSLEKFHLPGLADGMTIDSDGNLWVAIVEASRVVKIDGSKPETLLETIDLPTRQITSVAFGGPNLDELYVTTGDIDFATMSSAGPMTGFTYKVTRLGVKGLPMANFKLND